jgi:hypothetical protein
MVDDRLQADRILVAQLTGEARHRARWRELTDEEAAALAASRSRVRPAVEGLPGYWLLVPAGSRRAFFCSWYRSARLRT